MTSKPRDIAVIGAGINGLVAANYLARAGHQVTLLERKGHVGGACVSETIDVGGVKQQYALGASVLGLMQSLVWKETGLSNRLEIWAPHAPKVVHFPNAPKPTWIHRNVDDLQQELATGWGEKGDLKAFREDENKVIHFLQEGYRSGRPPTIEQAKGELRPELTRLWITGSAKDLLDHYLTSEAAKLYMAMTVTESGPVSLDSPYSAFTIPLMDSGSVFNGYYGFVRGGIWQIAHELEDINRQLGVNLILNCSLDAVDVKAGKLYYHYDARDQVLAFDHVVFATDPQTAALLIGGADLKQRTDSEQVIGTSGKLNLMFRKPVRWKVVSEEYESSAAFRFVFAVDSIKAFDEAAQSVVNDSIYTPGYFQIYCEGAAVRMMGLTESFDRISVFFKNLALGPNGRELEWVESDVKRIVLDHISNPEDCVWSRLLTPRDLQQIFHFPGGNLDHTMLVNGQTFHDRTYTWDTKNRFYQLGSHPNASICGASTYPCGSVTGTPAYMCVKELLRDWNGSS